MAGLTIPSTGTLPGLTVNSTPTQDLSGQNYNSGNLYNQSYSSVFGPSQAYADTNNTLNYTPGQSIPGLTVNSTPQNPGNQTPSGSTGGSGGQSTLQQRQAAWQASGGQGPMPVGFDVNNDYVSSQQNAAAAQAAAQIQATTNMYNNLRSQLETQRPVLESAYNKGLGDVQNQIDTGVQQGNAQQGLLTSSYNAGQGQLGQQYQQSQADNRELARAVGGNGSDYAQLQNRTNNSYQNNMYQAYNDYSTRSQQIQQGIQSLQNWGQSQKDNLATQYQQGINQLVLNENMTDFSKADAISKIQADYSSQLANINSVVAQFGNQLALAKAQVDTTAAMFGKAITGYDPLANMASMFYGSLGTQAPIVDTSGGISYPNQNKTAGGINTNNPVPAAGF